MFGKRESKGDSSSHHSFVRKGEEMIGSGETEAGRKHHGHSGAGRPHAKAISAKAWTGINPDDRNPIDPRMPHLQPP